MTDRLPFDISEVRWDEAAKQLSAVRVAVFVREQGVPEALEWDERDATCVHVLATDAAGDAIGTARLSSDAHVGRMAVLAPWRKRGVGRALLQMLIARARMRGDAELILNAQTHAIEFYRRSGFEVTSGEFMEAGIPHVEMRLRLRSS